MVRKWGKCFIYRESYSSHSAHKQPLYVPGLNLQLQLFSPECLKMNENMKYSEITVRIYFLRLFCF
jgi:hypothetical protein